MSEVNKKSRNRGLGAWILILPLIGFVFLLRHLLRGKNVALFNSKGVIAHDQHSIMMFTVAVLLAVGIPTMCILYFTAWKYRESSPKAIHTPKASKSKTLFMGIWILPTTVMIIIASAMWPATHKLAPHNAIASDNKPLTIQVISLRWKWLFLYPDQKIASVNFVQIPVNTPVTFEMTADETPMSSFWIPNLGGQLYTMTSHVNRLNLMATTTGDFPGSSAELNGEGFAGMRFTARASSSEDFDSWVQSVKQSPAVLDAVAYQSLLVPSENNKPAFYSSLDPYIYANVISKYEGPGGHTH